jgi:hypothetical protein
MRDVFFFFFFSDIVSLTTGQRNLWGPLHGSKHSKLSCKFVYEFQLRPKSLSVLELWFLMLVCVKFAKVCY